MADRPPIVLITTDELQREALSCYGNRAISTPNIDRLVAHSIKFNRAYTVSPWCLPARCAMLTGLLPHNSGAYSNFRPNSLGEGIPNLYTELGKCGYKTAHIGKCHFAPVPYGETRPDKTLPYDAFKQYYLTLGMDHLDLQDDKQVSVWFMDDYAKELEEAGHLKAYRDITWDKSNGRVFPFPGPAEWHPDSWVGRKSVEYIRDHDLGTPLFLWASFSGPHYPIDPPAEYLDAVDMTRDSSRSLREGELDDPSRIHHTSYHGSSGIDGCAGAPDGACRNYDATYWRRMRHHYYANVVQIDGWVGQILDTVEARYGDGALVIFLSDHGEMLGSHGVWGKNNCAYEEVWGIPLLVRYPGQRVASETNALVTNVDILATCLGVAGGKLPPTDGEDYGSLVARGGYDHVFAEGEGFLAVTDGSTKLVRVQQPARGSVGPGHVHDELYDREEDPNEFENRIADPRYSAQIARLRAESVNLLLRKTLP